ncbi:MAG: RAD52 family DNA repair protein, partial [Chloroflexi bacterium]|nr:RAD52 family DNA repair protein [Chloroflexota bacterium]
MNNGRHHNSLPPTRSGGNGTATAVRRNANGRNPAPSGSNRNGATAQRDPQATADRNPTTPAPEALHWDALAPRVTEALAQPLDPQLVSQRKGRGGRMFDYVEGHTAIDQANRIFGFGGWGYELVGDVTLHRIEQTDSRTGEVTSTAACSAVVKVSVPGAPARTDVGFQPVTDESAEGHETAYKGCVTDALKRALRSFGDRFGNGLYG